MFSHCNKCKVGAVRNPIRNLMHKLGKEKISDILKARISTADIGHKVLADEPRLEDYFGRLNPPPDPPSNSTNYFEFAI